ncbi:hypothetical protein ACFU96_06485 [Streptomyces sp. NPDC057620]|uniref:hypothetical protein n=1 Tax=Streptomyces sp. NPDC057620 TaxID=3346185 RepID=UPI0036CB8C7E
MTAGPLVVRLLEPVAAASPVADEDAGRTGPVAVGLPVGAGVSVGRVAEARWTLSAGPLVVRGAGVAGLPCVPPAPVVVALLDADAGGTGPGPAGAGLPVRAGVSAGRVAGARWTLSAGPLVERGAGLPGLLPVPLVPAVRLLEPVAAAPPDADEDVDADEGVDEGADAGRAGPAGAGLPGRAGVGLPGRAGVPTGPAAGARWTLTPAPAEGAFTGAPALGSAARGGVEPDRVTPAAGAPDETGPDEAGADDAGPGWARSDEAGPDGAGPDEAGPDEEAPDELGPDGRGPGEVAAAGAGAGADARVAGAAGRWATGRARRCTAGVAGALVSWLCRWGLGGAGVTRGPVGRDAVTGRDARCTGVAAPVAGDGASSGTSGPATGRTREGGSSPETGPADVVSAFLISPPGAASRTAWDRVPVRDGFCQVLSRPPKPESATPVGPRADRWIGGSPVQPTTAAGTAPAEAVAAADVPVTAAAGTAPAPVPVLVSVCAPAGAGRAADAAVPPLSRSRNPTDQPSAPPRVTRDAICSV